MRANRGVLMFSPEKYDVELVAKNEQMGHLTVLYPVHINYRGINCLCMVNRKLLFIRVLIHSSRKCLRQIMKLFIQDFLIHRTENYP
jgi:hypothetical protein